MLLGSATAYLSKCHSVYQECKKNLFKKQNQHFIYFKTKSKTKTFLKTPKTEYFKDHDQHVLM